MFSSHDFVHLHLHAFIKLIETDSYQVHKFVRINKENNGTVSVTDDYIFRSNEIEHVSLYDFYRLYKIVNGKITSDSNEKSQSFEEILEGKHTDTFEFLKGHPFQNSKHNKLRNKKSSS